MRWTMNENENMATHVKYDENEWDLGMERGFMFYQDMDASSKG